MKKLNTFLLGMCFSLSLAGAHTVFADVGNVFSETGGSSSSSGGSDLWLILFLFQSPLIWILLIIFLVGGTFLVLHTKSELTKAKGGVAPTSDELIYAVTEQAKVLISTFQNFNGDASIQPVMSENEVALYFREEDPDFSVREFKAYASDAFLKIQEAWEGLNWTSIRPFESDELFERHAAQLEEYIQKEWYPHLDGQEIKAITLTDAVRDGRYEYITVKLCASLYDYTTSSEGKIVRGSQTECRYREYALVFKRVAGVQTKVQSGNATTNCPNCGGPTEVTSSGQCEFCGSVITCGDYGWVLDDYRAWHN